MRIEDCIPTMSKVFLSRVVDSFISSEVPRGDENRLREQILQYKGELVPVPKWPLGGLRSP
jgi:hypothetical protein